MTTVSAAPPAPTHAARPAGTTPRRAALVAGVGYVALFVLAIFANFFVREALVVSGDAAATAANIAESGGLFRAGIAAFVMIFAIDIAVAWALYVLLRAVAPDLSLVAAWFRLGYTVLLGVAIIFFFQAMQLLGGADFLGAFTPAQLEAQALVALDSFNSAWLVGLFAFGIHLVLLGAILLRAERAPRLLAYALMLAGAAYMFDTVAYTMLATYADHAALLTTIVAIPSVIAEGWFGLWLLLRASKTPV